MVTSCRRRCYPEVYIELFRLLAKLADWLGGHCNGAVVAVATGLTRVVIVIAPVVVAPVAVVVPVGRRGVDEVEVDVVVAVGSESLTGGSRQ